MRANRCPGYQGLIWSVLASQWWLAAALVIACVALGFAVALFVPCWCGETWTTAR